MRIKLAGKPELWFLILSLSILLVGKGRAYAELNTDCLSENPQTRIQACTQIIQSKSYSGSELGVAYFARGTAEDSLGQADKAVADYTSALDLNMPPHLSAQALSKRGLIYYRTKETAKAISDFNDQIKLQPNASDAYLMRGVAYKDAKDYQHAIADLTEAIRLEPAGRLTYLAYFHRGMIYGFESEYATSMNDLSRAIEMQPDHADSYDLRGIANFKLKNYKAAVADLTNAIRLKPNDPSPYETRAKSYEALGQNSLALADYRRARELSGRK
jgi:tetratricopeptide (TPR) repeat protein